MSLPQVFPCKSFMSQPLMPILSTPSEEVLRLLICWAPELRVYTLQVAKQESPHEGIYFPVFSASELLLILLKTFHSICCGRVCANQGTQQNKWDSNRCLKLRWSGFCYEKTLFRKAWRASTVTPRHNPPIFFPKCWLTICMQQHQIQMSTEHLCCFTGTVQHGRLGTRNEENTLSHTLWVRYIRKLVAEWTALVILSLNSCTGDVKLFKI